MSKELRILILEDVAADAELMERELRKAEIPFTSRRVDKEKDYRAAIESFAPDLILADYTLPTFDGSSALSLAKEQLPDVPFIFISGTTGEETAIESLKSGATDYVLKGRISRLGPVVLRALREAGDRAERRRAEENLRRNEARLRTFLKAMPSGTGLVQDRVFRWVSERLIEMTGYSEEELLGRSSRLLYESEEEYLRVGEIKYEQIRRTGTGEVDTRWRRKDGDVLEIHLRSTAIDPADLSAGVIFTALDITHRKRVEHQLRQAQKMEALGTLAGGIAHDLNNILGAILGFTSLMKISFDADSPHVPDLETIEKSVRRGADLSRGLLAFARKGKYAPRPLNLNEIVEEVLKLLRETVSRKVAIKTRLESGLPNVMADEGQMHQVVMNLCLNACEAMPKGGRLIIGTERVKTDENFARAHPALSRRGYVALSVRDTGTGMDAEARERIFEPFFTTKEARSGTGLGLAMVYGIARGHDGDVEVQSEPGRGSTFTVYLPETRERTPAKRDSIPERLEGTETVLVIDDEETLRRLVYKGLSGLGYTVLEASSGARAVEVFMDMAEGVHLVILDVEMPEMDGAETFCALRAIRPDLKVLICTGSVFKIAAKTLLTEGAVGLIEKPFTAEELAVKVRQALDAE